MRDRKYRKDKPNLPLNIHPYTPDPTPYRLTPHPTPYFLIILLALLFSHLHADFILPSTDPVYPFLEGLHTLGKSSLPHFQYPLYYNDIVSTLSKIKDDRQISDILRQQADYHYRRLKMDYEKPWDFALYPPKKIPKTVTALFRSDPTHQRLMTFTDPKTTPGKILPFISTTKNETNIYISGILGYDYDTKVDDTATTHRNRKYYGVETAGNFSENFGYFLRFTKGHYTGSEDFIKEQPYISKMDELPDGYNEVDGEYYRVDMVSELDFKNPYLDLSMGYGSFDIGYFMTSSIVLNGDTTPYGYLKFHKSFGRLEYNAITAQLIPDSLDIDTDYYTKSMSTQYIAFKSPSFTAGVGNSIIYGDRTFDIAYSSPLALYKIMDNKNHGRDNVTVWGFCEAIPIHGISIYANFLYDDLKNERFKSNKWLNYSAYQAGLIYQVANLPLLFGAEATVVGPNTYSHKSEKYTFTTDDMILGYKHGSNLLNIATKTRFGTARTAVEFMYENLQQGSIGDQPHHGAEEMKFLAEQVTRKQFFHTKIEVYMIPEILFYGKYEYEKHPKEEKHYIFSGIEMKY